MRFLFLSVTRLMFIKFIPRFTLPEKPNLTLLMRHEVNPRLSED